MNVCDKTSAYYAKIICSEDLYHSIGKPIQNLNEKEKKNYLEILKSELRVGYKLN